MSDLQEYGLTPFDLIERTHLIELQAGYNFAIDLDLYYNLKQEIERALDRKDITT